MVTLLRLAADSFARAIDPRLGLAANEAAAAALSFNFAKTLQTQLEHEAAALRSASELPPLAWLWLLDALRTFLREMEPALLAELVGEYRDPILKFRVLRAVSAADESGQLLDLVVSYAVDAYRPRGPERRELEKSAIVSTPADAPALVFAILQLADERMAVYIERLRYLETTAGAINTALRAWLDHLERDQRERWSALIGNDLREF